MTGTPGHIPPELLKGPAEAGPDLDVFAIGVVMLLTFIMPSMREDNMFAHTVRDD